MKSIAVFFEHKEGSISGASLSALDAARSIAKVKGTTEIFAVVIGKDASVVAEKLKDFGLSKVYVNRTEPYVAASYAAVLTEAVEKEGAEIVVGAASSLGKDLFPVVSAKIDAAMASDILSVGSDGRYVRGMYAGNVLAEIELTHPKQVVSVRPTAFPQAGTQSANPSFSVIELASSSGEVKAVVTGFQGSGGERPDLGDAKIVVSGGRGVGNKEGFDKYVLPLADALGAAVGASRAAVDAGFAPNDWQVGQTGRTVAPSLYIAVGISGAIQHIAGMKESKTIVAITKDADAPIFEVADYGLVGDLTKIVPELIEAIKKK